MFAAVHHAQDDALGFLPLEHHLAIAQADHTIASRGECKITPPVGLERFTRGMKAVSIKFENESVADQHVYSTNSLDEHLGSHPDPQSTKTHSCEGLQAGLAVCVRSGQESSRASWQGFESADEVIHRDQFLVQSTIDRDESEFLGLA